MRTGSRLLQILFAVLLLVAAAIGALLGLSGLVDLIKQDVVRLSLLGEIAVGFGVAVIAGVLSVGYARGAFTRQNPPGAA